MHFDATSDNEHRYMPNHPLSTFKAEVSITTFTRMPKLDSAVWWGTSTVTKFPRRFPLPNTTRGLAGKVSHVDCLLLLLSNSVKPDSYFCHGHFYYTNIIDTQKIIHQCSTRTSTETAVTETCPERTQSYIFISCCSVGSYRNKVQSLLLFPIPLLSANFL